MQTHFSFSCLLYVCGWRFSMETKYENIIYICMRMYMYILIKFIYIFIALCYIKYSGFCATRYCAACDGE